jgi:glyoxylase-like metal-dependent hydrolase (beta-lactamase superfamily II)
VPPDWNILDCRVFDRMMVMPSVNRRSLLKGSSLAAATLALAGRVRAGAPASSKQAAGFYRFRLGGFELTAVYDGFWNRPIDDKFVRNAPYAEVKRALADAFMAPGTLAMPFTPLLVKTGDRLVLIDTGSGGQLAATAGTLADNLRAAGVDAQAIDTIVISNFHPDHIDGLRTKDNEIVFPNAEILVPRVEWTYWMDDANRNAAPDVYKPYFLNVRRIFRDLKSVTPFDAEREIAPGIAAIAAPGHTPGHCAFAIQSGRQSLIALCDTTNHPWLFARHPDWQPILDMDGPRAVQTRKRLLDRVAADRTPITGYHFPFPGFGHIIKTGSGYEFVPALWQTTL